MRTLREDLIDRGYGSVVDEILEAIKPTGNENVDLMRHTFKYAKQELERPDSRFDMSDWLTAQGDDEVAVVTADQQPPCGTTMCLAGTALWMSLKPGQTFGYRPDCDIVLRDEDGGDAAERLGAEVLGLTALQADRLFYMPNDIGYIQRTMEYMAGESME